MRTTTRAGAAALVLWIAAAVPAAAEDAPLPPAQGEPAAPQEDPAAVLAALQQEFAAAQAAWRQASRARPAADVPKDWKIPPRPEPEFVGKYAEAAKRFAGTEGAVPFLVQAVSLGRSFAPEVAKAALAELGASHAASPGLSNLTFALLYGEAAFGREAVGAFLGQVLERNETPEVRAAMSFVRGASVARRGAVADAERLGAIADLRAAVEAAPGSRYGEMAKGTIFELENLQIGMAAPEIEAADLDGVPMKLSEFRGKVVVLDFWGDW